MSDLLRTFLIKKFEKFNIQNIGGKNLIEVSITELKDAYDRYEAMGWREIA